MNKYTRRNLLEAPAGSSIFMLMTFDWLAKLTCAIWSAVGEYGYKQEGNYVQAASG